MAGSDRWYFTKEVLANTPSRRCGIDSDKELSYRQQAANLIQDMGQRLHVSQLCINTAIVYMHRFYTFHSFTKFHRNSISSCALFLAAKVEEQPRKLEHVIKVSHMCLHRENPPLDIKSEVYQEQAIELVFNENLMLQTLGFDIDVEHPHTSVVNCCQLVRASKDLAQTSYFMATNSLHLTTMCLQYKPTVVACVCIHLACKWSSWEIPRSSEGKDWFFYVDPSVTLVLLEQLTSEFLAILDKCPSRLKRKILSGSGGNSNSSTGSQNSSLSLNKLNDEKKISSQIKEEMKPTMPSKSGSHQSIEAMGSANQSMTRRSPPNSPLMKKGKPEQPGQQSNKLPVAMSYAAYRERKAQSQDITKHTDQSIKSNKLLSVPTARDINSQQQREKDKFFADKMTAKQQQINIDKQKQSDERHKLKTKSQEFLFDSTGSRPTNSSKPITPLTHPKPSQNNTNSEDFYENLMSKPSNFNSIFSTDGEDSFDFKREISSDLKMEFSDNSNQSNDGLNLNSFPSDFMNDSSDSKKSLINSNNNNNNINNNNSFQTSSSDSKPTSFMSIFSTPITTANPITTSTAIHPKSDNIKTNIPSKYNDIQSVLSRIKPEPPPPMLSPLKSAAEVELVSKQEKQSFSSHSSSTHLKPNTNLNLNQDLEAKQFSNSKIAKTSPKNRNNPYLQHKNSLQSVQTFRAKEVNESSQNIKFEDNTSETPIETQTSFNSNSNFANININPEVIASVQSKPENKEKSTKGAELPSAFSLNRHVNPYLELEPKPNVEPPVEVKPLLHLSPSPMTANNMSAELDLALIKAPVPHSKESKEKSNPENKHHKHSHKSSKHKDKHKHKHKDKDKSRDKHKRKDKDRDRDRDREGRHSELKEDPAFKISWSSPKEKADISSNSNTAPIKLKISKKKLSVDEPEVKERDVSPNPLKLRIQLKDQKLTANSAEFESNEMSSSRKRKSSPKSSKKEKLSKYESESSFGSNNNSSKLKDDKNSSKISSKSKKSNTSIDSNNSKKNSNNFISDEKHSTQQSKAMNLTNNTFGQHMNLGISGQTVPQQQRSSKAHK